VWSSSRGTFEISQEGKRFAAPVSMRFLAGREGRKGGAGCFAAAELDEAECSVEAGFHGEARGGLALEKGIPGLQCT
jgi:hypothetical protein